jgi:cold-inducible RNA-binding protein
MGKKLYVGSLPFEATDGELQELFSACGRVESARIIIDKATGRSKGFGFVEMATDLEAKAAIEKFNGSTMGSRTIVVNEARPMEDRKGKGGFGGGNRDGGFGGGRRDGGFGGGRRDDGFGDFRNGRGGSEGRDSRGEGRRREGRWGGPGRQTDNENFGNR